MADVEQRVTETKRDEVDETGQVVRERTRRVETKADTKTTATNVIWYVYGVIAFLLGIRFVLKLFGANSANGFVDFVYSVSGVLTSPFDSVFGVTTAEAGDTQSVFEPSILVAMAVYALIAWGVAKLLRVNEKQ